MADENKEFINVIKKLTTAVDKMSGGGSKGKNVEKERETAAQSKKQSSLLQKIADNTAGGKKEGGGQDKSGIGGNRREFGEGVFWGIGECGDGCQDP